MIEKVVIVHGHSSDPGKYWFEGLKKYLISLGCANVLIPKMPRPDFPDIRSWKKELFSILGDEFEKTAIIGHSFGGVVAFRFAEDLTLDRKLGAIIAVAAPIKNVWNPLLPSRILFREPEWSTILSHTNRISLVYSTNDWISPFNNALYLQTKLKCDLLSLDNYNHICCSHLPTHAKIFIAKTLGLYSASP